VGQTSLTWDLWRRYAEECDSANKSHSSDPFRSSFRCNQRRKGNAAEPYINHPIEVAELVSNALEQLDANLVIAVLRQDTTEDAGVFRGELAERFRPSGGSSRRVTEDKLLPKQERKRLARRCHPQSATSRTRLNIGVDCRRTHA
jgi:(p)ppGpp synthase/HD superfamily hydrolase